MKTFNVLVPMKWRDDVTLTESLRGFVNLCQLGNIYEVANQSEIFVDLNNTDTLTQNIEALGHETTDWENSVCTRSLYHV